MVWYADGSIQVEANGQVATGTGTAFLKNVRIGDGLTIAGSASMHELTNIASDTQLTFSPPYTGAAGAGKQYRIAPIQGYVKEAADRLREVLRQVGPFMASEALQALAEAETDQERRAAVSLGRVDNTADAEKPASEPQRQAFVERVEGKGLSQNDLTNERAQKLDSVQSGAQKNPDAVTITEAQAGAEAGFRSWSPVRVHNAINGWYAAALKTTIDGLVSAIAKRLPAASGTFTGAVNKIFFNSPGVTDAQLAANVSYAGAIEIREINEVAQTKGGSSDYAPGVTFHYGGYAVNRLWMSTSGNLFWGQSRVLRDTDTETGANANGVYVKFPDGTLIVWGQRTITPSAANNVSEHFFTTPAAFTLSHPVACSISGFNPANTNSYQILYDRIVLTAESQVRLQFSATAVQPYGVAFTAIGRWKP